MFNAVVTIFNLRLHIVYTAWDVNVDNENWVIVLAIPNTLFRRYSRKWNNYLFIWREGRGESCLRDILLYVFRSFNITLVPKSGVIIRHTTMYFYFHFNFCSIIFELWAERWMCIDFTIFYFVMSFIYQFLEQYTSLLQCSTLRVVSGCRSSS